MTEKHWQSVDMNALPKFRIVCVSDSGKTFSHADKIEDARAIAEAIDGKIQVYVYGIGWTYYSESMESEND